MILLKCGNANPKGNIALYYKGSCREEVKITDAYRCTGCGGWFHLDCILKHFEEEEGHDVARNALKKIKDSTKDKRITALCKQGLERSRSV